jgi:PAS domain S-box-containing protein
MKDERKTKKQLIQDLVELRQRIAELEGTDSIQVQSPREKEAEYRAFANDFAGIAYRRKMGSSQTFFHGDVEAITGYTQEELNAANPGWDQVIHKDDLPQILESIGSTSRNPDFSGHSRYRIHCKDGQIRWVHEHFQTVGDDSTGSLLVQGAIYDVTDTIRAEEALVESETKFRTLAEQSPNIIFIYQGDRVVYANERCAEVMAYSREELLSDEFDFLSLVAPNSRELALRTFDRHSDGEDVEPYEYMLVTKDGSTIEAIVNTKLIEYGGEMAILGTVTDITERKQAERALIESQARFRDLYENAPYAYFSVLADGHIVRCNKQAADLLGYEKRKLVGRPVIELYSDSPEGKERAAQLFENFLAGKPVVDEELQMVRADGSEVWISLSVEAVQDEQGQVVESRSVAIDISERKRIEETLRQRAEELDALQATVLDIAARQDLPILLETIVERATRLLGAHGGGIYLCEREQQQVRLVVSHKTIKDYRGTVLGFGEGAAGTIAVTGEPLRIDDYSSWPGRAATYEEDQPFAAVLGVPMISQGKVIGVLDLLKDSESGVFTQADQELLTMFANHAVIAVENARLYEQAQEEIAERKLAAEELQRRTSQLVALREVGLELAAELDLATLLESIVSRAIELVGGTTGGMYIHQPERDLLEWNVSSGIDLIPIGASLKRGEGLSGRVWEMGEPLVINDYQQWEGRAAVYAGYPPTNVVGVPVSWRGEFLGVLNIMAEPPRTFDLNDAELLSLFAAQAAIAIVNARLYEEARQHTSDLLSALNRLQELDHFKNQFIQNVSHELRSPLALIRGYADLMVSGELGGLRSEQRKPVEIIARRAQMLGSLVDDITLLAAAETRALEKEPVAISELVEAAVEDFRVAADNASLTLRLDIGPNLPEVSGEPIYLRRVLDNLLSNAVKFTPDGGTITVHLDQADGWILMQVSDTGIGISPEEHGRIFDRFYQVDGSSRRRYGGVGLGLALVKEIVEAHGGTVQITSEVGEGSTFTVTLPALGA